MPRCRLAALPPRPPAPAPAPLSPHSSQATKPQIPLILRTNRVFSLLPSVNNSAHASKLKHSNPLAPASCSHRAAAEEHRGPPARAHPQRVFVFAGTGKTQLQDARSCSRTFSQRPGSTAISHNPAGGVRIYF